MTPTNLQLATHYKLNKDTVQKWKKTRPEVYKALVNQYMDENGYRVGGYINDSDKYKYAGIVHGQELN